MFIPLLEDYSVESKGECNPAQNYSVPQFFQIALHAKSILPLLLRA
jgi:hypothetical protein